MKQKAIVHPISSNKQMKTKKRKKTFNINNLWKRKINQIQNIK